VSRHPARPGGTAPPATAMSPGGEELDLRVLAKDSCAAYDAEFPDERERYGPAGMQWCIHDGQHVLRWAALSLTASLDFLGELEWLARVLEARDFPLPRLARSLELLADTVLRHHPGEDALATRLRDGATFVRSRPTFAG
jgi:hypothetical protein